MWSYGLAADDTYQRTFYVVDGLEHDVLLGYDLIEDTKAFTRYGEHIQNFTEGGIDDIECAFSAILVKHKKKKGMAAVRNRFI